MRRADWLCALGGLALALNWVYWVVGPPRVYGTGCDWAQEVTGGFQLAQEEDELAGYCERVEPLPWAR